MKKIASAIAIAGLITAAGVREVRAGVHISIAVSVTKSSARGVFSVARNSADSVQTLECNVISWPTTRQGSCIARDAAGQTRSCFTSDAPMLDVMQSLNGDDYVGFGFDIYGRCTYVELFKGSAYEPKR